jgi:chromosome segregation ATPase
VSLFGSKQVKDPVSEEILAEIQGLKREVASLKGEREAFTDLVELEEQRQQLLKQVTDMEITHGKAKEEWDRERREVEHMVGLQRKRGEFESEAAVTEAKLAVREENLSAAKERFKEQMDFVEARFDQQFEALNSLMEKVFERMPTTRQLITVGTGNGNGNDDA